MLRLTAALGVDCNVRTEGRRGSIRFVVQGDGRELLRSELCRGGDAPRNIDLALKGTTTLDILVLDGGDGAACDHANLADAAISRLYTVTGGVIVLQEIPADTRFDDGAVATADVASYRPNAWGLYDMHGNAAEWTLSAYRPYPYRDDDRNTPAAEGQKVVRGGSFYDRPKRCRSTFRLSYPAWQRVHNVGFRVVLEGGS